MNQHRTLESIVDPFVRRVGGERISEIVGNLNPRKNADYLFRRYKVIAELKSLESGSFVEPFQKKMGRLLIKWEKERKFIAYGRVPLDSSRLPPDCQKEMYNALADAFQKHVVYAASRQIVITKETLNMPDAHGLLWVASDGNRFLQPNVVMYLLHRILNKRHSDGRLAYSGIDGIAYFSPRMHGQLPGITEPTLFWFGGPRTPNEELKACIDELSEEWPKYVAWAQGITITSVKADPDELRFLGEEEPRVQIEYPDGSSS